MKKGQEYIGIVEKVMFPNKGIVRVLSREQNQEEQKNGQEQTQIQELTQELTPELLREQSQKQQETQTQGVYLAQDQIDCELVKTETETASLSLCEYAVVKGTLPGQKVRFRVQKKRKGNCEGRLLEVVEPSKYEQRIPRCSHFGSCGGCSLQQIPYEQQLLWKKEQVQELLNPVAGEYEFMGIHPSPREWGYRNKMEFSFGDAFKDGPLSLGFHKKGSMYDIVDAKGCRICNEDFSEILHCVLSYCHQENLSFHHKMTHKGWLRHLLVRRAEKTGEILVALVTSSQEEKNLAPLSEQLCKLPLNGKIVGILHIINDSLADIVKSDRTDILYGRDYIYEELLGLRFKISTFSFFQTNSLGAEVLYKVVRDWVGDIKDRTIFDLYSGTGTIAQILAPVAKTVTGVEIVEEAVEAARENAELNGLTNCNFIAGDVLKVLDDLTQQPDFIVLDPPRDGIHPRALPKIAEMVGGKDILYISCNPKSLARDLGEFRKYGYLVKRGCCVDMFPGTVHVETIVGLHRRDT